MYRCNFSKLIKLIKLIEKNEIKVGVYFQLFSCYNILIFFGVIIMRGIIKYGICCFLLFFSFMMSAFATPTEEISCEALLGPQTLSYLNTGFTMIQIVGILLTILLGFTDFMGALLAGDNDANKKSFKKFVIRLSMMGVLLIVPSLLKLVLTTFGISDGNLCIL
jgi:phosphatidylglycerophosphate synthase